MYVCDMGGGVKRGRKPSGFCRTNDGELRSGHCPDTVLTTAAAAEVKRLKNGQSVVVRVAATNERIVKSEEVKRRNDTRGGHEPRPSVSLCPQLTDPGDKKNRHRVCFNCKTLQIES